jgi:hypothetical protein
MVFDSLRQAVRARLQTAADTGEVVLERLALAEVDAAIHAQLRDFLLKMAIFVALLAAVQVAGRQIEAANTRLLVTTTLVLIIWLYGAWLLIEAVWNARPTIGAWLISRQHPYDLARLYLYNRILQTLRSTFTADDGKSTSIGALTLRALRIIDAPQSWEGVAFRLADRLAPRLARHALSRIFVVAGPVLGTWLYYRFVIFPDLVRAGSGLGALDALLYPFAVLIDTVAGTELRATLLQ